MKRKKEEEGDDETDGEVKDNERGKKIDEEGKG